jgi:ppGpp synthetase/RelA/SpoT-type nucleotidyltranferase
MDTSEALDRVWSENVEIVRHFLSLLPAYERLSEEVAYILRRELDRQEVKYESVGCRAKTLDSFCEKLHRKTYDNPLAEITDLAGVRVVYLYTSDLSRIEGVIESTFDVIEKVDKLGEKSESEFGYGALHYLIKLSRKSSGARYDDLKDLVCEVQTRTILQDAWAIVAHHLTYKHESDVPELLRRKLNALSGLFETADDQFDQLRSARDSYRSHTEEKVRESRGALDERINLDNLFAFLNSRLPERSEFEPDRAQEFLSELTAAGITNLREIADAMERTLEIIPEYERKHSPTNRITHKPGKYNRLGVARVALSLASDAYLESRQVPDEQKEKIREFRESHLGEMHNNKTHRTQ